MVLSAIVNTSHSSSQPTRIFKNKWFARFAQRQNIEDQQLCDAVARAQRDLIDADLGGRVIKQRIPRPNEGRSGGYRSILLFQNAGHIFFVYGFAKNERDNISQDELDGFRALAEIFLAFDDQKLQIALSKETLTEVKCDAQNLQEQCLGRHS